MGTFKKLFASIAAVMIVVSTAPVAVFGQTSRSAEYQDAYAYAFANGITTMGSIDAANLAGTTTRGQAAKMFVEFAKSLGQTADTSASCSFSDLAPVAGTDLEGFAIEACQMGLMGINTNGIFNPNGVLSRAEYGTILSRVLFGDTYNGGNPFYAAHLNALNQAGLMNDLSNPERAIMRGDAFLLLYRASEADLEGVTPGFCADIETVFACTIDPDGSMGLCPAACLGGSETETPGEETEVKAGGLSVSLNSASLANNSQIPQAGTVRFAVVDFSASSSSDVNLKSVEIAKVGLATIPSSTRVWFEKDGVRVTGRAAFTSEGKAVLSFAPALKVKANGTETLDLFVELNTTAGNDFQFQSAMVDSSALSVSGGFSTPVLRTVNYTVSSAAFNDTSVGGTQNVTANGMELGSFSVTVTNPSSEIRDAMFKSITLRQNGNASLSNLGNIVLERNGEVVSSSYVINGRDLTFSVNNEIKDGTVATYYIKAVVNNVDQSTDVYEFELRNDTDLNIVEKTTSFRLTVTGAQLLGAYNIQGGDITFARDTAVALSAQYAGGTQNVTLLKGTLKTNSAITLEDPSLAYGFGMDDDDMFEHFSTIYMSIGGSTFSYSPVNGGASTTADFLGTATVNGTVQVKVRGTLKDTAPQQTIKVGPLQLTSFNLAEYVSNGNTVASAIGTIEGVNVSVESSTLNVVRTDGLGNQTIAEGSQNLTVLKLTLSSNQGNGVRVSRAIFDEVNGTALANNNSTLTLYVDGQAVATKQLQGSTVTFDFPSFTVNSSASKVMEVKATFAEAFNAGDFQLALDSLQATDVLTTQAVSYQTPTGAEFTIGTADADLTASTDPILTSLLLSPATAQQVLSFRLKALNDNVTLKDIDFVGTDLDNLNNFRLTTSTGVVIASASSNNATTVVFTNIAQSASPVFAKDQNVTLFLVADVNSNLVGETFTVTLNGANVRSSNGSTIAANVAGGITATHDIDENTFVVAKAANASKSLATSALRFTITASGKDSVLVNSIDVDAVLAGYQAGATVEILRNNVVLDSDVAGAGVTLQPNVEVAAGTTTTFVIRVSGAVVDPMSNSQDWSVTLTEVDGNGYDATDYDNVGKDLPFTESRFN